MFYHRSKLISLEKGFLEKVFLITCLKNSVVFSLPVSTCPSCANSCCFREKKSQGLLEPLTFPLPLGLHPWADEAHVRSDNNNLEASLVNYWRELWPCPSIIPTACCGRANVNDKLTSNLTNKLPIRTVNWFCRLCFDKNQKVLVVMILNMRVTFPISLHLTTLIYFNWKYEIRP